VSEFVSKDGKELELWEVPLKTYMEVQGYTSGRKPREQALRIHAMAVADALLHGLPVPEARVLEHTVEMLGDARQALWSVLHGGQKAWDALTVEERVAIRQGLTLIDIGTESD
jgi:hypothetical protein